MIILEMQKQLEQKYEKYEGNQENQMKNQGKAGIIMIFI